MVESGSNTDSDEKRDTVPALKAIKKKNKGKKPMEDKTDQRMRTRSSWLQAQVDSISQKTEGIKIDNVGVTSGYSLRSGLKEPQVDRKRKGKEKKTDETAMEKVRKRIKRETLNAARKRKGKETEEARDVSGLEADPEEACKRIRKGRNNDEDDADKDGPPRSAGAYATRSSTRNMMLKSN